MCPPKQAVKFGPGMYGFAATSTQLRCMIRGQKQGFARKRGSLIDGGVLLNQSAATKAEKSDGQLGLIAGLFFGWG